MGWAWNHWALWPLKIIVVLFHELGHAAAAWATGGEVLEIGLNARQGGYTISKGGSPLIILNAGYLGSMLSGVLLLVLSKGSLSARATSLALAILLLVIPFLFMPWLSFGQIFSLLFGLSLLPVAIFVPGIGLRWGLRVLGVFSVLYGVYDVWSDVLSHTLHDSISATSDAAKLAALTGIPSYVWGIAWITAGVSTLILGRKLLV